MRGKQKEKRTWNLQGGTKKHPKHKRLLDVSTYHHNYNYCQHWHITIIIIAALTNLHITNITIINTRIINLQVITPVPLPARISDLEMVEGRRDRGGLLLANCISISRRSRWRAKEVGQEACWRFRGRLVNQWGSGDRLADGLKGGFVALIAGYEGRANIKFIIFDWQLLFLIDHWYFKSKVNGFIVLNCAGLN